MFPENVFSAVRPTNSDDKSLMYRTEISLGQPLLGVTMALKGAKRFEVYATVTEPIKVSVFVQYDDQVC